VDKIDLGALFGSAAGGSMAILFAKAYLQRALKEIDQTVKSLQKVKEEIAVIMIKLEITEKNEDVMRDHDRKIARLEAHVFGMNP